MINTSRTLTGVAALLSLAVFCPIAVNAEPAEQLISQLRGHETYEGDGISFQASKYHIGRVRGLSGNVMSIELFEPVVVGDKEIKTINIVATDTVARRVIATSTYSNNSQGYPIVGDDVGVVYEDGKWEIVGRYHPYWVSRLELREVPKVERSAFIWDPQPFGLPPLKPSPVAIQNVPEPEPVRGMW